MRTKFFLAFLIFFTSAYAGTPAMGDTSILYGLAIVLLLSLIGVPYLIKFIKNKMAESKQKNEADDLTGTDDSSELGKEES